MKFKLLAGAAMAAVFAASGASAQVGWYGAIDLGYHWAEGIKGDSSNLAANGIRYTWRFNQEDDWAGFARLGYQFRPLARRAGSGLPPRQYRLGPRWFEPGDPGSLHPRRDAQRGFADLRLAHRQDRILDRHGQCHL